MSSNLARPHFKAPFAPGFKNVNASLQAALPSPDATSLDERLLSHIQEFNKVIKPPANVGSQLDDAERCSQDLLWNLSRQAGLTLRVLEAAGHVAEMDTEGLTTSQLIACINSILGAGLKNKRVSATSLEANSDIIQAAVQAIPGVIDKSWPRLRSRVCVSGAPSADDLALLDGLIRLGCIATELIGCGHVISDAGSTQSEALQEFKSEMSRSEAFEELMLQFVIHRDNSSNLKVPAITNFSGIFGSSIPNLSTVPPCLNELGSAIKSILVMNDSGNRYSPTVDMIYTILSSDQLRGYFQARGSTQEGSDDYPSATSEENELFDVLSEGYWKWLKGEENRLPEGDVSTLSIRALIVACCLMSLHLSTSLIIFQRSFLPLVARGLLAWQWLGDNALSGNDAFGSSNWQEDLSADLMRIGKGLQAVSSDLSTKITISTGFIDTMNTLQQAKHLSPKTPTHRPLSIWKEFCEVGEVNERAHRQERRKEWANDSETQLGCQWAKCPSFGTEILIGEDWLCKGCRKAVYCGEFCWKSDFATHSAGCSGSVSRRPSNRDRRGTREPQIATG